jgi:hypothetical protein
MLFDGSLVDLIDASFRPFGSLAVVLRRSGEAELSIIERELDRIDQMVTQGSVRLTNAFVRTYSTVARALPTKFDLSLYVVATYVSRG